jgi:hypothetical protein
MAFIYILVEQDFVLETECDDQATRQIYTRQTTRRPRLSNVSHPLEFPVLDNIVSQLPVSYASTGQALRRAQDQNHLYIAEKKENFHCNVCKKQVMRYSCGYTILTNFENAIAVDEQISCVFQ